MILKDRAIGLDSFGLGIAQAIADGARLHGHWHVAKYRAEKVQEGFIRLPSGVLIPLFKEYRDNLPYEVVELSNGFLNSGINELWAIVDGTLTGSGHVFSQANTQLGVGDSSTSFSASHTDLQAASNKTYKTSTSVTTGSSQAMVVVAAFATGDANYAWQEVVVKQATSAKCLNRGVSSLGTKTSAGAWTLTTTLTLA